MPCLYSKRDLFITVYRILEDETDFTHFLASNTVKVEIMNLFIHYNYIASYVATYVYNF